MRSKRPAPQFWPRIGPTAPESANRPPKATGTRRSMMALAAIAVSPKRATTPVDEAAGDRRRDVGQDRRQRDREQRPRVAQHRLKSRAGDEPVDRRPRPRQPTATKIRRDTTVAIAAPSMPRPRPKIRSGSSPAVTTPPDSVTYMARLASPTARRMPENAHPERHEEVRRQDDPQEALVRPAASRRSPRGASRIDGKSGRSTSVTAAPASTACAQAEPASRRALPASPAPSARDTSAPTAIISPTLIETAKNRTIVAKPDAGGQRRLAEPGDVEQRQEVDDEDGDEPDRARRRSSPRRGASSSPRRSAPSRPAVRVPARFRQAPARSSSPMMSRVSRERPCGFAVGALSGSGSRRVPCRRSAPPMMPSDLLHDEAGDVAAAHVARDRRRLLCLDAELLERRTPEAQRRFEGLAELVVDLQLHQIDGVDAVVGAHEGAHLRELLLDDLDDLQGGLAVVDADADDLAPGRCRRRAARRAASRRRRRRGSRSAPPRGSGRRSCRSPSRECRAARRTWSTTCPKRPKPTTRTDPPAPAKSSGSGSGRPARRRARARSSAFAAIGATSMVSAASAVTNCAAGAGQETEAAASGRSTKANSPAGREERAAADRVARGASRRA